MDGVVLTAHEIYSKIHGGPGTGTLAEAAQAAEALAGRYEQRQARIIALRRRMMAAWQGNAADAAEDAMSPLVRANENALVQLEVATMYLGVQVGTFRDTFNDVVAVPEGTQATGVDAADPYAVDADGMVDEHRNKATRNVWVYQQYVMQSQMNGSAMPWPYPTVPAVGTPAVTVRGTAGGASAEKLGDQASLALGAVGDLDTDISSSDSSTSPSLGGAVTEQGWGPDPTRVGNPVTESTPRGPQPSDGAGVAALGGTARNPGVPGRSGFSRTLGAPGRGLAANPGAPGRGGLAANPGTPGLGGQVGRRPGSGEEGVHRSVLRSAAPVEGPGGMWGSLPPRAPGEDDSEHTRRYGRYLDPDELFACDLPVSPAVIGLESDDEDGEDD